MNALATRPVQTSTINHMKKLITLTVATAISVAGLAFTASAHENEEYVQNPYQQQVVQQTVYDQRGGGRGLERSVYHLNRMLDHVSGELSRYGANRHTRSEYGHLRAEFNQLNYQFHRGAQYYDRRRLRAQIDHMHAELHHLEEEMHVPDQYFYQWR